MKKWLLLAVLFANTYLGAEMKVLAFAASLRADSYNKKLVNQAAQLAREMGATVTVIDLQDYPMPFYDADLEAKGMPESAQRFRQLMIDSDAIIIASPEYNGSIPGMLKNALDWASRSEDGKPSRAAFKDKRFALMSTSPGGGGGARALVHLRLVIENVGGEVVTKQVTVPHAANAFTAEGGLENVTIQEELQQEIKELLQK